MKICHPNRDCGLTPATRVWMDNLASKHPLTKLEMNVGYPSPPPPALFSCETLIDLQLTLYGVCLNIPDEVNLPNMKHLSLHGAYFSNSEEFRALMNGCRALEVLKLEEFHCSKGGMEMRIDLPELKVFRFNSKNEFVYVSLSANKLEVLEFRGMFFRVPDGCFFPEMKAVVCLEIDQWVGSYLRHKLQNNLRQYGGRMNNIVRALRETRTLSFNEWCTEYLTTIADTLELPYFRNLKQLEISLWSIEGHMYIVLYLIKRSPFLESLKLQTYETFREDILIRPTKRRVSVATKSRNGNSGSLKAH
ncbi:hypothetical protein LUZ60_008768 [Juncus effusus]|nr:hypothetical protein LUZ60_008768 [Juncus effusus]